MSQDKPKPPKEEKPTDPVPQGGTGESGGNSPPPKPPGGG